MNTNNDTAEACLSLVRIGGPVLMRRGKSRGNPLAITAAELCAIRAAGFEVGFRVTGRVATPHKKARGPRSSAMIVQGTMAAAMEEYLAIEKPVRGTQKAIAKKYGINKQTFAVYLRSPARRASAMQYAK